MRLTLNLKTGAPVPVFFLSNDWLVLHCDTRNIKYETLPFDLICN